MSKQKKNSEVKASAGASESSETQSEANTLGLEPTKIYNVVATVTNKYFKEGQEMQVLGKLAEKMINNNQAKLKD
jgi:hypothetical protein